MVGWKPGFAAGDVLACTSIGDDDVVSVVTRVSALLFDWWINADNSSVLPGFFQLTVLPPLTLPPLGREFCVPPAPLDGELKNANV